MNTIKLGRLFLLIGLILYGVAGYYIMQPTENTVWAIAWSLGFLLRLIGRWMTKNKVIVEIRRGQRNVA